MRPMVGHQPNRESTMTIPEWPREITLDCSTSGEMPSSAILVHIQLITKGKNNVSLAPRLSDDHGRVLLSLDLLEAALHAAMLSDPMDYGDTLTDCVGLRIVVEGPQESSARLRRLRRFYPKEAEVLADMIRRSSNEGLIKFERDFYPPFAGDCIPVKLTKR